MPLLRTISLLFLLCLATNVRTANAHPWGGLVVDAVGRIFFTFVCPMVGDSHVACVWRIDPGESEPKATLSAGSSPSDLVLTRTRDRQLFAAQRDLLRGKYQSQVWKLFASGEHTNVLKPTRNPFHFTPEAYTVDEAGTLIFTHENKIYRHTLNGEISIIAGEDAGYFDGDLADARFERISAMAWGPDSSLYFVDMDRLRRISPSGEVSTIAEGVKEQDPENLPFRGANIIFDMAVDSLQNVYLAYYGNRRILKVSPAGEIINLLDAEDLWSPHGIDVYDGEIYILESTVGVPEWWEFWKSVEIRPRVRKINRNGDVEILYEYPRRK